MADDIGPLYAVEVVKLVGANAASTKWQLETLLATPTESGEQYEFPFDNWLVAGDPAVTIYRSSPNIAYKVLVYTSGSSPLPKFQRQLLINLHGM